MVEARRSEPRSGARLRKRPRPRRRAGSCSTTRPCVQSRPVAARVPLRLLAGSRPSVRGKRTVPHASKGHSRFSRCCTDSSKKKTGFAPPGWPGECEVRTRQYVYFGPSEMVKSTELPEAPKTAIVTLLVPWNEADEISSFLVSPSESFVLNCLRLTVIMSDSTPGVLF
jgi:hypothetical protein